MCASFDLTLFETTKVKAKSFTSRVAMKPKLIYGFQVEKTRFFDTPFDALAG